jgi:Cu/Ag efflux pump CusA
MGWTIIGGLLVSTFLTLVVVPVLYAVLEKRGELVQRVKEATGKRQ